MTLVHWIVLLVAAQRAIELVYSARNARRLIAAGAVEWGRGHYPLIVALHVSWLASLGLTDTPSSAVSWPLIGAFVALQAARVWTIRSLGPYWTTRIVRLPGGPRIRRGPYRYLRHPNYLIVAAEIAVLPLALGAWWIAAVFSAANAALMAVRIGAENAALDASGTARGPARTR